MRKEGQPFRRHDAICPMEEDRDHDMEEADDDPNQYFNTAFDNEVTMSQPYEYEMHVPEPERPRECKKSLFMPHVTPTMRLYLPRVGARLRGIAAW